MKSILIIEREFGCGAAEEAEQAAQRLGWRFYAPRAWKIQRVAAPVGSRAEAEQLVGADLKRYRALRSAAGSWGELDLAAAQARSNAASVDVARSRGPK